MAVERISIIPFMRKKAIEFFASNLRPDREANFFFDDVNVTPFVQNASTIIITGTDATKYTEGEAILCAGANSFATVIKSVSPNKLFINENYLSLRLDQYSSTPLNSSSFETGDIIFQGLNNSANLTSNTFAGRVEHWFLSNTTLIVSPISGTANNVTDKRVIHSVTTANKANLNSIRVNNKFPASVGIVSKSDALKTSIISSYSHSHGVISGINPSTTKINLSSSFTGTTPAFLKITEGAGYGKIVKISSMESENVGILDASVPITDIDNTSKYTIALPKVDKNGNLAGIFNLPETSTIKFKTGERLFTITDVGNSTGTDATMRAMARYNATSLAVDISTRRSTGSPNERDVVTPVLPPIPPVLNPGGTGTVQPGANTVDPIIRPEPPPTIVDPPFVVTRNPFDVRTGVVRRVTNAGNTNRTRNVRTRERRDPVAQTFFTPDNNYGIFVSSIDIFFKSKPGSDDAEIPVIVRIVETVNGYPSSEIIASSTVQCNDVNVTDGVTTFPRTTISSTATKFRFDDPVFLNPSNEYAIVVFSDSPSYEVWISELGQTIIGDVDNRRVSEQPYVGSFFRSQNASTWTPYQNQDLMFTINRAVFATSPTTLTFNAKKLPKSLPFDELIVNATEIEFPVANVFHKLKTTKYSNNGLEADFRFISENKPFWFAESTEPLSTIGRRRVIPTSNTISFQTQVILDSDNDAVSPFFNAENYSAIVSENLINNGELYDTNFTVIDGAYHTTAANVHISDSNLYPNTVVNGVSSRAAANVVLNASGNVVSIMVTNPGKGYVESPTVTITEEGKTANAVVVAISENEKYGGNALCRYITRKVTLADGFDSGDLRVTVRGIRPQGTNIVAFYKVQSATDSRNFSDVKWRRMYLENDVYSPDLNTAIEFKYNPSADPRINKLQYTEDGVTYPLGDTFKHFSIKIVLLAECGCVAPTVRNLRVVALPEG